MKRSLLLIVLVAFPLLAVAQASGGQIRRPSERSTQRSSQDTLLRSTKSSVVKISEPNGYVNGHGYVDLGLSSGIKWATCNVGASSPEEFGNYYAWGETATKAEYNNLNTRVYEKGLEDISANPEYDAACVNWCSPWRVPTKENFNELINSCKWRKVKYNNIVGCIVIGPNGKSIFFPFGSMFIDRGLSDADRNSGNYWTSTSYNDEYFASAWFVYIKSEGPTMFWGNYMYRRGLGLNIRPVCDK